MPTPKARTPTAATARSANEGRSAARTISQAAVPARPTVQASAATPRAWAPSSRARRGRAARHSQRSEPPPPAAEDASGASGIPDHPATGSGTGGAATRTVAPGCGPNPASEPFATSAVGVVDGGEVHPAVGHGGQVGVVGGHHHADTRLRHGADGGCGPSSRRRVELGGGLVEEHEAGAPQTHAHQGTGQGQAATLAAGELSGVTIGQVGESELGEHLLDGAVGGRAVRMAQAGAVAHALAQRPGPLRHPGDRR